MAARAAKSYEEVNAFSRWRHNYFWRPGERKAVKRRANRRERREAVPRAIREERD